MNTLDLYYHLRPFIPRPVQIAMRRCVARKKRLSVTHCWPILESAGLPPDGWRGWPENKKFALVLTHDVETRIGHDKCRELMDLEESLGFRSSFNLVPERYRVDPDLRAEMTARGFEVGVHGLVHDGHLFKSRRGFETRRPKINGYLKDWSATGFRSPSTRRNLKWIGELDIKYDSSTFDTDPFEPESEGVGTIFPFIIDYPPNAHPYVELPYTLPQDSTLFIILGEDSPCIWKEKLDWIARKGGMALINTHPDYMCMDEKIETDRTYPSRHYQKFIDYISRTYRDTFWHGLPCELEQWLSALPQRLNCRTLNRYCMAAYSFYDYDNRVRRYAETLVKRGDTVDVISLREPEQRRNEVLNGVNVFRIQSRMRDERSQLSYLFRILKFWVRSSAVLVRRQIKSPYSVIHVHSIPDFEVFAAWFPRLMGAKVILDIHDLCPEFYAFKFTLSVRDWRYKMLLWLERMSTSFADAVIVANHIWMDRLISRGLPPSKCLAIPNYVDLNVFSRHPKRRKDERFILSYPGGLQKHQGVDIAVSAMPIIRQELPAAELHIFGDGPEKENIAAMIQDKGLAHAVHMHPMVPLSAVPPIMANADLGIVPKRTDGFGNEAVSTKIMEFMSQGVPVVASRAEADMFYFPENCLEFFESGNACSLAQAVIALARQPDRRNSLRDRGWRYVAEHNWDKKKEGYLELIERLNGRHETRLKDARS